MQSLREEFGKALVEIGREDERVVVLDADLASSTKVTYFAQEFPERFFQVGIAEQNMIGMAAGLALMGRIPFTSTFGVFNSRRVCDQVALSVAHAGLPVKLIGAYTGILCGNNGATHQPVEDVAIMRALPNMVVVDPADAREIVSAVRAIVAYDGPVYLRMSRDPWPVVTPHEYEFKIGRAVLLREGGSVGLVSSGMMASVCLDAADILARKGVSAGVLHMPTIKPLDVEAVVSLAKATGCIVTAENHNIIGGLGGAVAEVLGEEYPTPLKRVGLADAYGECGGNEELMKKYGLTAESVADAALHVIARKRK